MQQSNSAGRPWPACVGVEEAARIFGWPLYFFPVLMQSVVLPHGGRWFFAATAVGTNGLESDFSSEVSWESKPAPPAMSGEAWVRLTPVFGRSTNLAAWGSVTGEATWFPATNRAEWFRVNRLLMERVMVP